MKEGYCSNTKMNEVEYSDIVKLLSKTESSRLVVPEMIDGIRVEGVSRGCFYKIEGLKEIVFPKSLLYVEYDAITYCDVERISFGKNLKFIDTEGLRTNKKLNHIEIEDGCPFYRTIQGNLYINNGNTLDYGCNNSVAEGTIQIGTNAFLNSNIESVIIPDSVTDISRNAFMHCKNLKDVQFTGQKLVSIGSRAFQQCNNVETIKIPGSVLQIGAHAFKYAGLKELIFEDREKMKSTLTIGPGAFMGTNIEIVDFSKVDHLVVGAEAFLGTKLSNLTLNRITVLEDYAFKDCSIEEITLKSICIYDLMNSHETLGKHTAELKKLIEKFNNKNIDVTYILHENKWIEDRFW